MFLNKIKIVGTTSESRKREYSLLGRILSLVVSSALVILFIAYERFSGMHAGMFLSNADVVLMVSLFLISILAGPAIGRGLRFLKERV